MQDRHKTLGMQPSTMTLNQIAAVQKAEVETWSQVIKVANIKLE